MKLDWIVSANACSARVYSIAAGKYKSDMTLIRQLEHPAGRMSGRDLVSDGPGHYRAQSGAGGKFAEPTDPKANELDKFVKRVAEVIEEGRAVNAYQKVIIVAAPHFYGLVEMHLSDHTKHLIQHIIHKDHVHDSAHELQQFILDELN